MRFPSLVVVRDLSGVLDPTYVAGNGGTDVNDVDTSGANQLALFLTITKGSLATVYLKVELVTPTGGLYQEVSAVASGGLTALRPMEYAIDTANLDTEQKLFLPIPVLGDRARISAKGLQNNAGSQLQIHAAAALI